MKIAIFDENSYDSAILKRLIYTFSNNRKMELVVDVFTDATELISKRKNYILFFISFKTKNGILISKKIYDIDKKTPIIITANDCCLAAEAFKINAYNFLQTPFNDMLVYKVLNDFFSTVQCNSLLINDGCENIFINTNDIIYIEANNKHCFLHLNNQIVFCNKTMAKVYNVLPKERFLKTSRAFVVNADYVLKFNREHIILINGDILYPSRHFYKTFKYDFLSTLNPKIP